MKRSGVSLITVWLSRIATAVFIVLNFASLIAATPEWCKGGEGPNDKPGAILTVSGHTHENGLLTVNYSTRFPGITCFFLEDAEGKLLWKGRSIDETAGDKSVRIKTTTLSSGSTYFFRVEHKNVTHTEAVILP